MRCKDIEVTMTIPFPVNRPDDNGVIYTEEAVVNAFENVKDTPIITYENDKTMCIGVVTSDAKVITTINQVFVEVSGKIRFGGTEESVEKDEDGKVISMELTGVGLTK